MPAARWGSSHALSKKKESYRQMESTKPTSKVVLHRVFLHPPLAPSPFDRWDLRSGLQRWTSEPVAATLDGEEISLADYERFIRCSVRHLKRMQPDVPTHEEFLKDFAVCKVLAASAEKAIDRFKELRSVRWELWELETAEAYTRMVEEILRPKEDPLDEEIEAFYNAHIDQYTDQTRFVFRNVFFDTTRAKDEAEKEEVKRRAEGFLSTVTGGKGARTEVSVEDFTSAAEAETGIPAAKFRPVGPFSLGEILTDIEAAALTLNPGQVSKVVETKHGYQVLRLEKKTIGRVRPLSEVSKSIANHLRLQELNRRIAEYRRKHLTDEFMQVTQEGLDNLVRWATDSVAVEDVPLGRVGKFEISTLDYIDYLHYGARTKLPREDDALTPDDIRRTHYDVVRKHILFPAFLFQEAERLGFVPDATYEQRYRIGRITILGRKQFARDLSRLLASSEEIPEEEAKYYYSGNLEKFSTPVSCRFREIAVQPEEADTPPKKEFAMREAEAKALAAVERIKAGSSEEDVIREVSAGEEADKGGLTDWIPQRSRYTPEMWEELSNLVPGQWTQKPYRLRGKAVMLKVEDRTPARQKPFEECIEEVRGEILKEKRKNAENDLRYDILRGKQLTINEDVLGQLPPLDDTIN